MPKVSVIIPVYNVDQYLSQCLDSVVNQTLEDIEIICVDDGSTDNSLKLLMEYAEKDSRVIVLKQQNKGAGVARNYGMTIAKGKYFSFLDSDDFFSETLLMDIVQKAEADDADIVVYRFEKYNQLHQSYTSCEYAFHKEWWPNGIFNKRDNPNKIFNSFNLCAWNKLFNASFLKDNKLYFQDNKRTNDLYFTCSAMAVAERIALVDKVLAYYRVGLKTNSQSTNHIALFDFYKALVELKRFLKERDLYEILKNSYFGLVVSTCIYNITNNELNNGMRILRFLKNEGYKHLEIDDTEIHRVNSIFDESYKRYVFSESLRFNEAKRNLECIQQSDAGNCKVSVIIPVYNVEKYLRECLESVINQSLKGIEIVCVNDGSTDGSLLILEEYAQNFKSITLLVQDNCGLSVARNTGVEYANGKYLYFLDSDDKLRLDALEELYKKSERENLDVLYFDAESFFENHEVEEKNKQYKNYYRRSDKYKDVISGRQMLVRMVENNEYRTSVPLHFISKAYYDKQQFVFVPGLLHEDNIFAFECMLNANKVAHLNEPYFLRRVREDSIMTKNESFANAYGYFVCALKMMEVVKKLSLTKSENDAAFRIFNCMLSASRNIYLKLSNEEKGLIEVLNPLEAEVFTRLIVVKNNVVTTLPNTINGYGFKSTLRRVKQCCQDHGLRVTVFKIIEKLRSM